jgi:hypothetical protein
MRRTRKQIVRAVRVLTDPQPNFVSQVRNGANQTPTRIIKADDAEQQVQVTGQAKEASMAKAKTKTTAKKVTKAPAKVAAPSAAPAPERKVDVHSIFFPLDTFKDEPAVKAYLGEHGYTADAVIEKDALGWTVKGSDADQFEGDLRDIETDGVTITVGYLKADAQAAEPAATKTAEGGAAEQEVAGEEVEADADAEAAERVAAGAGPEDEDDEDEAEEVKAGTDAGAEAVERSDTPVQNDPAFPDCATALTAFEAALPVAQKALVQLGALEATSKTDAEAVRKFENLTDVLSYMDDVPPGFYDLMQAFSVVVRYAVQESDLGRVRKAARDMGEYIIQLADLFKPVAAASAKGAEAPAADAAPQPQKPASTAKPLKVSQKTQAMLLSALAPQEPAQAADANGADNEEAEDESDDPVIKAVKALGDRMGALADRVEQIAAAQAPAEGSQPTPVQRGRKGEDGDAVPAAPSKKEEKVQRYIDSVPQDRLYRNSMGLPQHKH